MNATHTFKTGVKKISYEFNLTQTPTEIWDGMMSIIPGHFTASLEDYERTNFLNTVNGVAYDSCNGGVTTSNWCGRRIIIRVCNEYPLTRVFLEITSYGGFNIYTTIS